MSLIKTAGASAAFFYPSYINGDTYTAGGIVASTMQALAHRLYQMDPTAPWQGSAGVDDSQVETITATLYSGVAQVQRVIDSIFILGNNLNNFVLQYSVDEGSTWTNIATVTGNAGADYVLFLDTPLTLPAAGQLQLSMSTTFPANQEKYVCNFIATQMIFQASKPPTVFTARPIQNVKEVILANGTRDLTYFYWSDNSFVLNDLEFNFDLMPVADKNNFDALLNSPQPFICYPEPGDAPRALYLCVFEQGSYNPVYISQWKGAGYKIPAKFHQVGFM